MENKLQNIELCDAFSSLISAGISQPMLSNFIYNKVGLTLNVEYLKIPLTVTDCWGGVRSKQYPDELAGMLMFMYEHRDQINTYCEIGLDCGGTFYTIDSFMRATNPNFKGSIGVDVQDRIYKFGFKQYSEKHPSFEFHRSKSIDFILKSPVDFMLIDGDHSYGGVKADYERFKGQAKFIALHDIYYANGVRQLWDEIKNSGNYVEITNQNTAEFPGSLGIGIIWS